MISTFSAILILLALLFTAHAAACNARMDTVKDHWNPSIFNSPKYNPLWYNPALSWADKDNRTTDEILQVSNLPFWIKWLAEIKPGWDPISDFWHWQKTNVVCSVFLSAAFCLAAGALNAVHFVTAICAAVSYYAAAGIVWIIIFNWYYNHKLKS